MSRPHPDMTDRQWLFCQEYLSNGFNGKKAAMAIGCKEATAGAQAHNWLDPKGKWPHVSAFVEQEKAKRADGSALKAEYVKQYVHDVMEFNPLEFFEASDNGGWEISIEAFNKLPKRVTRLIEEFEYVQKEGKEGEGTTTKVWLRIVSKTAAMTTAARYTLTQKIEAEMRGVDWNQVSKEVAARRQSQGDLEDIDAQITQITPEQKLLPPPKKSKPSTNGESRNGASHHE